MTNRLEGLIAATFTPFLANGSLNFDEVPKMVEHLIGASVQGIYICGSTGEGMSLTTYERQRLAEIFITAAAGRLKTVVHVGHNSLAEARQLATHAQAIGADIVSATAPSYYKIDSVEMLVDSMAEVALGAPDLPFYYYHIPALTGAAIDMPSFLLAAERRIPNLVGLKYTAPTVYEFQACQELADRKFDVIWGCDEMLSSALAVGARAAIGSTYNITAPLNNDLISAFDRGDLSNMRHLQMKSVQLVRLLYKYPFHAAMKLLLSQFGVECGGCRLPLRSLTQDQKAKLIQDIESSKVAQWLIPSKEKHLAPA